MINIDSELKNIGSGLSKTPENLKKVFGSIDLTSLGSNDTHDKIRTMCQKVNRFSEHFPSVPNVGAICVYPNFVSLVKDSLEVENVGIASVGAGFPSSQTFPEVKELECRLAVGSGATEIDIVISIGRYLSGDLEFMAEEIKRISEVIKPVKLKVILETGLLPDPGAILEASALCLENGADFIKTSTGKEQPAATPEAMLVMCRAVKDHFTRSGRRAGLKPAGGISTPDQALLYAGIVENQLGPDWLHPSLFRIGASRLANNLLNELSILENGSELDSGYF